MIRSTAIVFKQWGHFRLMRWAVVLVLLAPALAGCVADKDLEPEPVIDPEDTLWLDFQEDRVDLLEDLAPPFLECFQRRDATDPASPIFHGCLDWHSAVHAAYSHHVLFERSGEELFMDRVEEKFYPHGVSLLGVEHLYQQAKGFELPYTENPYGFGWFLLLAREREQVTGNSDLREMADYAADMMVVWYQARLDEGDAVDFILNEAHPNYSWSLINLDIWARYTDDAQLRGRVERFSEPLLEPMDCPVKRDTNESQEGFQPACLMRLAAVAHVWGPEAKEWVMGHLPEGFRVPFVEDPVNCHAGGLNFSRAFALHQLYWLTNDTDLRNNSVELIRYHVDRPDLYAGDDYLEGSGYLCYGHWVAQFGVRTISLSYEEAPFMQVPSGSGDQRADVVERGLLDTALRLDLDPGSFRS